MKIDEIVETDFWCWNWGCFNIYIVTEIENDDFAVKYIMADFVAGSTDSQFEVGKHGWKDKKRNL